MEMNKKERELLLYNSLKNLHLLEKTSTEAVMSDLIGLQAQFTAYPKVSLQIRADDFTEDMWNNDLVKIWSHRGTMHLVHVKEIGLHLSSFGYFGDYNDEQSGFSKGTDEYWADVLQNEIRNGNITREGLKEKCRSLGMDEELEKHIFHGWGGLIKDMAYRGKLVCCTSSKKEYRVVDDIAWYDRKEALRILLERYFTFYGPATKQDCHAFFGLRRKNDLNELMKEYLPTIHKTKIAGKTYYHAEELVTDGVIPDCVMVPGFDQLILGYRDRERMMDKKHVRKVTNISGIIFPVLILRGRIRARWKIEGDTVTVVPFEKLLKKDEKAIRQAVRKNFGKTVKKIVYEEMEE